MQMKEWREQQETAESPFEQQLQALEAKCLQQLQVPAAIEKKPFTKKLHWYHNASARFPTIRSDIGNEVDQP
jgi:hypothetical protein